MKRLMVVGIALAVAGCSGVPTGRQSPCFGTEPNDGTFVTFVSTQAAAPSEGFALSASDCDFERF